ncbi:hypothetical protein [Salinigranum halophilum]|uniref:hypothetical protein n=1 Tax=Salinigranum halophilum TaxID=2565931 RepID=UPI0013755BBA|nr:hypothetical protein [Salinigranum halophilum]
MSDDVDADVEIDEETIKRIQNRILDAEAKQLHLQRPHNIIPEVKKIIEEEVN